MIYKYTSIKRLLAKVVNDHGELDGDWRGRAPEWVADGLGLMEIGLQLEDVSSPIDVTNYTFTLPCDLELLRAIEYEGYRLPMPNKTNALDMNTIARKYHPTANATLNPAGFVRTSFETGQVQVHYKRYPLDEDGLPKVPDNTKVREALSHFILLRNIMRGYKHPLWDYVSLEKLTIGRFTPNPYSLFASASNSAHTADASKRHQLSIALRSFVKNDDSFYNQTFDNSATAQR